MTIATILNYIEQIAPPAYQENYDNAGLIVGDRNAPVRAVLICLDSLESVLDEAIEKGCNLIIAHHPIVFSGLKRLTGNSYIERILIKAIKNEVAIYAAHTNLDNVFSNGVNAKIAEKLALTHTRILAPKKGILKKLFTYAPIKDAESIKEALFEAGAGNIGNYGECSFSVEGIGTFKGNEDSNPVIGEKGKRHHEPEQKIEVVFPAYCESSVLSALQKAHPYEEIAYDIISLDNSYDKVGAGLIGELKSEMDSMAFLTYLKKQMQTDCVRYTHIHKDRIHKVAVCGGAGSFLLRDAIRAKADVFITGDFKYHQFFDAENRIIIADIGHFESEQFTIDLFYDLLMQKFPNFAFYKTTIRSNPINYL